MACINSGLEFVSTKIQSCFKRNKGIENKDNIAERWEILSGKNNWEGLLDPLDYDLRRYIIQYGQMSQAVYDSFNSETASKNIGTCRYSKKNLFTRVGLEKNNPYKYQVTKYFYAASDVSSKSSEKIKASNWMGFVAIATNEGKVALGRRDILISWRGTMCPAEYNDDDDWCLVHPTKIFGENTDILVHRGFYSVYTSLNEASIFNRTTSCRDQVLEEVKRLVEQYKNEEISITLSGHSLGSSLATLCAVDIVVNQINKKFPVTAFLFGCPRVGEENFKKAYDELKNLHILRISNASDPVPKIPDRGEVEGTLNDWRLYTDVGFELSIDTTKSQYLKKDINGHILEVYLHGVAGTQGTKGEFMLELNRDIALVNKEADVLKEEYGVPVVWWIVKNKGMVQQEDGFWILMDHGDE